MTTQIPTRVIVLVLLLLVALAAFVAITQPLFANTASRQSYVFVATLAVGGLAFLFGWCLPRSSAVTKKPAVTITYRGAANLTETGRLLGSGKWSLVWAPEPRHHRYYIVVKDAALGGFVLNLFRGSWDTHLKVENKYQVISVPVDEERLIVAELNGID